MASADESRAASPTPSQLPPVPSSPVYSLASTANPLSQFSLPLPPAPRPPHAVLTKADLEKSQEAYTELLASAKTYRKALATLSTAASAFGSALESCARLKEARAESVVPAAVAAAAAATNMTASFTGKGACTADTLLSASGVQQLVANHQQILSETVYRAFEVPLLHDLDRWQTVVEDEEQTYQQDYKTQTKEIKRLEKEGMKLHKQRRRDVGKFRAHLVELTNKLDGLTTLHGDHARTLLRESQETSGRVAEASCSLVRAEVDIFESLARKGWTGGGLDELLEKGQDLFAADDVGSSAAAAITANGGSSDAANKLFSILPPKSILADSASMASGGGGGHHNRTDSLLGDGDRYQSLAAVAEVNSKGSGDADSVLSADFNKPRNARPFSPQPIRRRPTDVTFESLGGSGLFGDDDELQASMFRLPEPTGDTREDHEEHEEREHHDGQDKRHGDINHNDDDDYHSRNAWQSEDENMERRFNRDSDNDHHQRPVTPSTTQATPNQDRPTTPIDVGGRRSPEFLTDESSPESSR